MIFQHTYRAAAFALLAMLALLLSGCSLGGAAQAPTAIPVATVPASQPTLVPLPPTVVAQPEATQVAGQPTAAPAVGQPTFAFEPRQGGPGTTVSLRGWGFAPNAVVKIGVGFPTYTGGALGTTNANARGEWQAQVVLPTTQPSPGPDWSKMVLIALDGGDKALASAPFSYIFDAEPAPPTAVLPAPDGWQTSHSGDFNGDGLVETLTYRPASPPARDGFGDAALDANALTVDAVQVLQEGAHGLFPLISIDGSGVNVSDGVIATFASDARPQGATAFRLALGSGTGPLFYVLPLDENGHAFTQALALVWNEEAHAYRVR